jgi:hypothetical protein
MLPVTLVLDPVITPPTTLAAVTAPDTDTTEPNKLEPVTVPVELINPVFTILPLLTLPLTLILTNELLTDVLTVHAVSVLL